MNNAILEELRVLRELAERLFVSVHAPLPMVLTKKAAAWQLSVSVATIDRLVANGTIRAVPVGGRVAIPLREVVRLACPADQPQRPIRSLRSAAATKGLTGAAGAAALRERMRVEANQRRSETMRRKHAESRQRPRLRPPHGRK